MALFCSTLRNDPDNCCSAPTIAHLVLSAAAAAAAAGL